MFDIRFVLSVGALSQPMKELAGSRFEVSCINCMGAVGSLLSKRFMKNWLKTPERPQSQGRQKCQTP